MKKYKKLRIVVKLEGGLGNQFYQYAASKAFAVRYDARFEVLSRMDSPRDPRRHNHLGLFSISAPQVALLEQKFIQLFFLTRFGLGKWMRKIMKSIYPMTMVRDPENGYNPTLLEGKSGTIILLGYWQSFKYFQSIRQELIQEFQINFSASASENLNLCEEIQAHNSVAIHIRRGDYVNDTFFLENFGTCSLSYYQKAMDYISARVRSPHFYIFSDDPDWVQEYLVISEQHTYVTHNLGGKDYEDFRLMSSCKSFIIANSSFSWWAAWLAPYQSKIVLCPETWFINDPMPLEDRIPEDWVKIPS